MDETIATKSKPREDVMKFLGLAICLGTLVGAAATVRIHLYVDILSFLFVVGGAVGFLVMKNKPENHRNSTVAAIVRISDSSCCLMWQISSAYM